MKLINKTFCRGFETIKVTRRYKNHDIGKNINGYYVTDKLMADTLFGIKKLITNNLIKY